MPPVPRPPPPPHLLSQLGSGGERTPSTLAFRSHGSENVKEEAEGWHIVRTRSMPFVLFITAVDSAGIQQPVQTSKLQFFVP